MSQLDRVLVVAAHPDDEVLGCGGAIARHCDRGDVVDIVFLADGVASRPGHDRAERARRRASADWAAQILGARPPHFANLPDQELDGIGTLAIAKIIETYSRELQPTVVYTHHHGDLNVDHRLVSNATLTAFRPLPFSLVRTIYGFEVLSSSEWRFGAPGEAFHPARFVDLEKVLPRKLEALKAYAEEMRAFPHPRSYEAVKALSVLRGVQVGLCAAEAFTVYRDVVR